MIRWIEGGRDRRERVAGVPRGDEDGGGEADIAYGHANVVGDLV
jgi:hypothetical protein